MLVIDLVQSNNKRPHKQNKKATYEDLALDLGS